MGNFHQFPECVLKLCEEYFAPEHENETSLVIINVVGRARAERILKSFNEDEDHDMTMLIKDYTSPHHKSNLAVKAKNYLLMMRFPDELPNILESLIGLPTWNPLARY